MSFWYNIIHVTLYDVALFTTDSVNLEVVKIDTTLVLQLQCRSFFLPR